MKIALIGNMNNANFALMRYFRDLGCDAHLLLYSNDGQGALGHFRPESDTWQIERWQPYIHQTDIPNAPVAALDFPYSSLIGIGAMIRSWLGFQEGWVPPVSRKQIRSAYAGYDRLVASGISPATLSRAGIALDIFFPYSTGVEFLRTGEFLVRFDGRFGINSFLFTRVAQRQIDGIRAAHNVLNAVMGMTNDVLLDIGVRPRPLPIVAVYGDEMQPDAAPTAILRDMEAIIAKANFTLLHQARLLWSNPGGYSNEAWIYESKNNDWLLRAFSCLIQARPNLKPLLLMVEYGPDVALTKQLAAELGIDTYIHWLPKMNRRDLTWLLSRVDVGVGQFYVVPKMIWAGTGWEALANGKPCLQTFMFDEGEFEQIFGYPPPPMLPVRNQEDILQHLLDLSDHPERCEEIGRGAKEWFNRYNGIGPC